MSKEMSQEQFEYMMEQQTGQPVEFDDGSEELEELPGADEDEEGGEGGEDEEGEDGEGGDDDGDNSNEEDNDGEQEENGGTPSNDGTAPETPEPQADSGGGDDDDDSLEASAKEMVKNNPLKFLQLNWHKGKITARAIRKNLNKEIDTFINSYLDPLLGGNFKIPKNVSQYISFGLGGSVPGDTIGWLLKECDKKITVFFPLTMPPFFVPIPTDLLKGAFAVELKSPRVQKLLEDFRKKTTSIMDKVKDGINKAKKKVVKKITKK
jgi:hypothetical protein